MNRYLWIAIGVAATLLLAISALAASPLTRLPPEQVNSRGIYIQFDNIYHNIDPAHGYPVAGGHMRWGWNQLEPNFDNDYRFTQEVRPFVMNEASRGKKAGIGFETYVGRINVTPPMGGLTIPDWLWQTYPNVRLWNDNYRENPPQWYVLNFLDPNYKAKYAEFIYAFADWLAQPENADVRANIAWVEMGIGLYGEAQPAERWQPAVENDYWYYVENAPGGENPPGWTANDWIQFVNWCTDTYYNAFRSKPSLSHIVIFLSCAPEFRGKDNKDTRGPTSDYAAVRGIGLKNNGLQEDRHPYYLYGPLEKWGSVVATKTVPIAWETYDYMLHSEWELYWGLLCALDKHPDIIEPDRWLMVDGAYNPKPNYVAIWDWVAPYLGVDLWGSPGIWCALRETEFPSNGEPGNYSFWLWQRDNLAGGTTVAEWNVTSAKEGRYTRRTDQATGNRYMHFQVINRTPWYTNPMHYTFLVHVTYLNRGLDSWKLTYDSFSGMREAGTIQKTNTDQWLTETFVLTDARFGNGLGSSAADLTIDCLNDGNEYIHMVEIVIETGPTPTTTPTPTTIPCTIQGSVTLQRPNQPPPDSSWSVPLTVTLDSTDYAVTTDESGGFTLTGLAPGTYDIGVKNPHTLRNLKSDVTLAAGTNPIDFGTLLEGDANDDNCVNILDFSLLATFFTPLFDERADFNEDGYVNISDFSLLAGNFGECGDIPVSGPPPGGMAQGAAEVTTATGTVQISIEPLSSSVVKDQVFAVDIRVAADGQFVDGAEVHLDFDPLYLEVVNGDGQPASEIESGEIFDVLLRNHVNNAAGEIDFAAGKLFGELPSGTFVLATIRFKALQGTGGSNTQLAFSTELPRKTDVTYGGSSVLASTTSGSMIISTMGHSYNLYLPFVLQ